jgi:hypothetical protein
MVVRRSEGPANTAVDFCTHHDVIEVLLRFGEVTLGRLHVGLRVVHVLLRDGVLLDQRLEAIERALGILVASERAPIGRLGPDSVEAVEHLTRLYRGAFGERPRFDHAVHPRAHLDATVGIHLTGDIE